MVEDQEVDDQCSFYFQNCKGITDEELDEKYEDGGHDYLLDNFGEPTDFWTIYQGELDLEDGIRKSGLKNDFSRPKPSFNIKPYGTSKR